MIGSCTYSTSTQIMGLKSKLNKNWYTFDLIDFFTNRSWELVTTPLFVHVHTYIPTATGYLHILASMSVLRFYEKLIPIRHFWAWGKNGDGRLNTCLKHSLHCSLVSFHTTQFVLKPLISLPLFKLVFRGQTSIAAIYFW